MRYLLLALLLTGCDFAPVEEVQYLRADVERLERSFKNYVKFNEERQLEEEHSPVCKRYSEATGQRWHLSFNGVTYETISNDRHNLVLPRPVAVCRRWVAIGEIIERVSIDEVLRTLELLEKCTNNCKG